MAASFDFKLKLPSLKELAETRIVRQFWQAGPCFSLGREDIEESYYLCNYREWLKPEIEDLPIPKSLQDDLKVRRYIVLDHFYEIALGVRTLMSYYEFDVYEGIIKEDYLPNNKIRWNAFGNVDFRYMVDLLLEDEAVPLTNRFELGCRFCRHLDVRKLWAELREELFNEPLWYEHSEDSLVAYWISVMMEDDDLLTSPENLFNSHIWEFLQYDFYQETMEYLWKHMSDDERGRSIEKLKSFDESEVRFENWYNILSLMSVDERAEILTSSPARVLRSFLKRPYQHLFFPLLRLVEDSEIFVDSLPTFLMYLPLEHCDQAMRRRLYDQFRPFFPRYVHDNPELGKLLLRGDREYVFEVMRGATKAQKLAAIRRGCSQCWKVKEFNSRFNSLKFFIEAWLDRASWRELKERVRRRVWQFLDRSLCEEICQICDSIDEFFGL